MADVPEWFAKLMLWAAEAFPQAKLREGTFRAYYAVLGDLPQPQVRAAFLHAIKDSGSDFFPSAPKVRSYAVAPADDAGLLAWSALHEAAAAVGAHQDLDCEDPAVAEAVRRVFGGWPEFCEQAQDALGGPWLARRQEWLVAYREARRMRSTAVLGRLAGYSGGIRDGTVWVGRLRTDGTVTSERDRPVLPAGPPETRVLTG